MRGLVFMVCEVAWSCGLVTDADGRMRIDGKSLEGKAIDGFGGRLAGVMVEMILTQVE